jgi:hypothetical protein
VRPSHGDYKPSERRRYVPSGQPRRKIPVIRVALLLGLVAFAVLRFDAYWPSVRGIFHRSPKPEISAENITSKKSEGAAAPGASARGPMRWSADSSRLALDCPRGLSGACCENLDAASPGLCAEAASLAARAGWKGLIDKRAVTAGFVRVEAQARIDESTRRMALSGMAGRDARGGFVLRRRGEAATWCDGARGCLGGRPAPVAPLSDARVQSSETASGEATWLSASPWVRAVLPGRVLAVDSVEGGVIVRLYHGLETYTTYGPLRAVAGVRPGAIVKTGSHLGDAPLRGALYALNVNVRQGGRPVEAAAFWSMHAPAAEPETLEESKGTP